MGGEGDGEGREGGALRERGIVGRRGRAPTRSSFQKWDLSENWTFWIPAPVSGHEGRLFAGMTDLGAIFHVLRRGVVENRP